MCEQTEINYLDGEVVWVKLGSCWWPGEVISPEKLPPDVLRSFRKPPIAIVKFFQEDKYEYVKNINFIYKYNCSRKHEFINKGLYMFRTKHGPMEKFPEDIVHAETVVGGDVEILNREEFQETKKQSYAGLFGDPMKKTPGSGKSGRGKSMESLSFTPIRRIKEKTDYKVHILVQGSKSTATNENTPSEETVTPSTSCADPETQKNDEKPERNNDEGEVTEKPSPNFMTPVASSSGIYSCHACPFTTSRLNVLILHNKTHSISFTPYTPSPVTKKITPKSSTKTVVKVRRIRTEKRDKLPKVKSQGKKRTAEQQSIENEVKKPKTDEEIKSSLLADWDDVDDESNDESTTMIGAGSPEVALAVESPAVPTPAELPSAQVPAEISSPTEKKPESLPISDKLEQCSDSKYEFCEDEDWPLETDAGRKIPRVKNPKRKDESKSLSLDDEDVAREVAELLNKTSVPELPSVPEPLKVEENFPEPSIVKSPDKNLEKIQDKLHDNSVVEAQPSKAIFKTKTFFRSRHSRSQDAIGKYVAEQLNAVERMDISESEINGSEVVSSPEARESPPIEHVKVARLAPKIQLKKMKAEAAQLREKEKYNPDQFDDVQESHLSIDTVSTSFSISDEKCIAKDETIEKSAESLLCPDVIYPTQEIKPVCSESSDIVSRDYIESKVDNLPDAKDNENDDLENNGIETANHEIEKQPQLDITFPELPLQKSYEPLREERYMNESTASAVDALLSVSRDTDRVTRNISNDPPEELFEDDNKENPINNNVNGNLNENLQEQNYFIEDKITIDSSKVEENGTKELDNNEPVDVAIPDNKEINNMEHMHDDTNKLAEVGDAISNEHNIHNNELKEPENIIENVPSESDLQIAETLINLPSTALQNKTSNEHIENIQMSVVAEISPNKENNLNSKEEISLEPIPDMQSDVQPDSVDVSPDTLLITNNENIKFRYETEQEKSENLNAAQSLVQMSESVDHKINIIESSVISSNKKSESGVFAIKQNNGIDRTVEQKVALLSNENNNDAANSKGSKFETSSSKLLKILEEPCIPRQSSNSPTSQVIVPRKDKILNFDVANATLRGKSQSPKQKIIIRRTTPSKNAVNSINEVSVTQDKLALSRSNPAPESSTVQTFTIQTSPDTPTDTNTIIIQQKIRKISKPPSKLQKIKPHNSLVAPLNEPKSTKGLSSTDDAIFDINSMPIVLSEDLLTPENIEKMPVVMSDGNLISHTSINPPKLVKSKQSPAECEKIAISATPNKPEVKTLLMNPNNEVSNVTTPNILSKSSKLRGAKTMLLIDKTTGKQKIIMTKAEPPVKEVKQTTAVMQSVTPTGKAEKFILLPTPNSPRPSRAQKIVIDPQTGKAHVLLAKGTEPQTNASENKPVSAKIIAPHSETNAPGNTVMIITNAQGAQSRILLTPEHEKILFPNKQQANISQLKTLAQRITTNSQKSGANTGAGIKSQTAPVKTQTRIVPKQKNTIITSKGQLIIGGRVGSAAQNIAPMPEARSAPKRIMAAEPKKLVQTVQKTTTEPLIFLQQKSGAMMQLTAAQFEHMQKTGQIVQRSPGSVQENKILVQKSITLPSNEPAITPMQKTRIRKTVSDSPTPMKKMKQEIAIAPAPVRSPNVPVPALTPISNTTATTIVPSASNTVSVPSSAYNEYDNFEELLPSTAISRQREQQVVAQTEQSLAPPQAALSDGQLLAVPGEPFGGPPGSFYLCVEDNGTLTPIDNRPLILENNQLVPMAVEPLPVLAQQPERRDILEAALANSDVFHAETPRDEAPDFRDLNANVSVHSRVSETSTTLNQPIMTPVEMPTKVDSEPAVPSNLEDGLAVIGVTPHTVPTSLELPITITDPRIAPKTTDPLSSANYGTTLLSSPNTEMSFATSEETDVSMVGPISMPLLTEEESVGKSMPILTDEITERTVSSVESTIGSPSSIDVRESETEDGGQWTRRLLTPGSDISEASVEIPLQPVIQLSVNDMSRHS